MPPDHEAREMLQRGAAPRARGLDSVGTMLQTGLLVATIVALACLFGIWTRIAGQLAVFWPANALLMGMMLRFPRLDTPAGWLGAVAGHLAGGYFAGDAFATSALLTLGNFASVVTGYLLMVRRSPDDRRLAGPASVLHLLWIVMLAAVASGVAGAMIVPVAFGRPALESGCAWFVSEVVNGIAILPAVLTVPSRYGRQHIARQFRDGDLRQRLRRAAPLLSLLLSLALALLIGGPGAIAFPVPALLWCGMSYGLFPTALLTLLTTTWTLLAISKGYLDILAPLQASQTLTSIRLGVTLIALSPIAAASAQAANTALLRRLRHMADIDPLTGTMNRRAFSEHALRALHASRAANAPAGLLILDIDRFKSVNDTHGHAAGDLVIAHVVQCLREHLPPGPPLLGRLGGEEFALLLPGSTHAHTLDMAERVRASCARHAVDIGHGRTVAVTASIGACVALPATPQLDQLLHCADQALYQAKHDGRNRVVVRDHVG